MAPHVSIKWRGNDAKQSMTRGAGKALRAGGEFLLQASDRTVPVEEVTLERSGKVSVWLAGLQAKVSYDTPYARRQHEDLTLHHAKGRRAKWLQKTLDEQGRRITELMARIIREANR